MKLPTGQIYAKAMLDELGVVGLVDVREVAAQLKLELNEVEVDGFDGALIRAEGVSFGAIAVRRGILEDGRKNFTIAHEIGHYVLPGHEKCDEVCLDTDVGNWSDAGKQLEREADEFAAELLIPTCLRSPSLLRNNAVPSNHQRGGYGLSSLFVGHGVAILRPRRLMRARLSGARSGGQLGRGHPKCSIFSSSVENIWRRAHSLALCLRAAKREGDSPTSRSSRPVDRQSSPERGCRDLGTVYFSQELSERSIAALDQGTDQQAGRHRGLAPGTRSLWLGLCQTAPLNEEAPRERTICHIAPKSNGPSTR